MRKFASILVLILVAYIAGTMRHFGTDEVLAFFAPAVPYVTFFGDAVWSGVEPLVAPLRISEEMNLPIVDANTGVVLTGLSAWVCLLGCVCWAARGAILMHGNPDRPEPFPSAARGLWNNRPEVGAEQARRDDVLPQRTLPLWMALLILLTAISEFGARVFYFVGFTVVALIVMPLKALFTLNVSAPFVRKHSSTHKCEVVRVLLEEHPNADRLSIVKVHGHECAVRTKEWKDGDLAVCIPPDSVVPDTERFKFLGDIGDHRRIGVKKIRERVSYGLLVHAPAGVKVGDDCMKAFGVRTWCSQSPTTPDDYR